MQVSIRADRNDQDSFKHWTKVFPEPTWKAFGEHAEEEYENEERDGDSLGTSVFLGNNCVAEGWARALPSCPALVGAPMWPTAGLELGEIIGPCVPRVDLQSLRGTH